MEGWVLIPRKHKIYNYFVTFVTLGEQQPLRSFEIENNHNVHLNNSWDKLQTQGKLQKQLISLSTTNVSYAIKS